MTPARKQAQAGLYSIGRLCLWQDASATGDDRVCGKDTGACAAAKARQNGLSLRSGHTHGVRPRQFPVEDVLVNVCGLNSRWADPNLFKQGKSPRTGAGEDEPGTCHYLLR